MQSISCPVVLLLEQNQHGWIWNIIQSHENWFQTMKAVFFLQVTFEQQLACDVAASAGELPPAAHSHVLLKRHQEEVISGTMGELNINLK